MKRQIILVMIMLFSLSVLKAQDKYFTKSGRISFYSKAPLENIEAHNKSVTCVLDTRTGNLQFAVLMKGFEFEKALMQEHFNENYVESHKYPKADFKGQIVNTADINFSAEGTYAAVVKGKLTIKGETRDVETTGTIVIKNGKMLANAEFSIELADFKIEIPRLVKDNISKTVKISVDCSLEPLKG